MTKTHTKRGRAVPRALAEDCRMQPNICTPLSALGRAPPRSRECPVTILNLICVWVPSLFGRLPRTEAPEGKEGARCHPS
jgi:hypothetical protein